MHALVVDDSRLERTLLATVLRGIGCEVAYATKAREALSLLAEEAREIDIMFVDWNMPEMNGIDLVRAVRAIYPGRNLRIMMVTVENQLGAVAEALRAGADEYVMKPFHGEILTDKLALLGIG